MKRLWTDFGVAVLTFSVLWIAAAPAQLFRKLICEVFSSKSGAAAAAIQS